MASADYRLCDVCSGKAFYDSNLNYTHEYEHNDKWGPFEPTRWAGEDSPTGPMLDSLGDWAVLCRECAKTHACTIVKREPLAKKPTHGQPRLCPGCRALDGEHDFGETCTLREGAEP